MLRKWTNKRNTVTKKKSFEEQQYKVCLLNIFTYSINHNGLIASMVHISVSPNPDSAPEAAMEI